MIKAPISLQDLRRRIYREAKADKAKRFWSLENDSHKIGSGGKLVMGLMELTGVRKYR